MAQRNMTPRKRETMSENGAEKSSLKKGKSRKERERKRIGRKGIGCRVLFYIAGLFFMAFGVAFSVNSKLGVSPVNSLPYVLSLISGINMGTCVIAIFSSYILIQILLLKRQFPWINLTQILFSAIFGYFVDLAKWVVGDFALPAYFGQLGMLAISILLVAIGVCLYMDVNLVNMPMEGMTCAVKETLFPKRQFHDVKVIMDCGVVGLGILLSLVFLGKVEGIREGTVICALLIGKLMKPLQKVMKPFVEKICFPEEQEEKEEYVVLDDNGRPRKVDRKP